MAAEQLKNELKELDFQKPETIKSKDLDQLIIQMVQHIGSTDPVLRDKLIYSSFYHLTKDGYLNHQQMEYLIQTCLDQNHLFIGIGSMNEDSVFTRAFSTLVIALILDRDREERFLSEEMALKAIESSILYLQKEEDTRGYVEDKGWAHSVAHGADLLAEAIKHPLFDLALASECLTTVGSCILKDTAYIDEEDERLIYAVIALLEKGMDENLLKEWIVNLSNNVTEIKNTTGYTPYYFRMNTNLNQFIKSLYFRLLFLNIGLQTRQEIEHILKPQVLA
ncbi:DUF2785 domain-containing protein [Mesobacillus boroniphilus]|uniref:DUF2785 domain-containing protein n=1 Tax=Mesobacillus boroniphilus TaxID=308892 RepID=A0A944CIQ1_9BACI|nr:DUF2785 domain-containing protein [Mesobacillus boroniphilus]MBS8263743.1 DUF2785 domain-containing protein [Mesobacillus boroniphilus]